MTEIKIPQSLANDAKDTAEDALKSQYSKSLKDIGIDDMEDIDEALDEELLGGDVLVVEYTPFNGKGINYRGNDRYYLKPNDVKLSILEEAIADIQDNTRWFYRKICKVTLWR